MFKSSLQENTVSTTLASFLLVKRCDRVVQDDGRRLLTTQHSPRPFNGN